MSSSTNPHPTALHDSLDTGPVSAALNARIRKGDIELDPVQVELARELDELATRIENQALASKSSSLGWLFSRRKKPEPINGLYIHGSVGRGKSMLMDLFYNAASTRSKRRAHFHEFMADAQDRIHLQRQAFKEGRTREEDPIPPVARALAEEAQLLCFDEFSVTDIADAMILGRLFKGLFDQGVVIVATSNVAPDDLYSDGLNRQLFLPFIDMLKQNCTVRHLDARTDYRMEKLDHEPVYLTPLNEATAKAFDDAWESLTVGRTAGPTSIRLKGRSISVPLSAGRAARFTFAALCEKPLGARDYQAIVRNYDTLFIEGVPQMDVTMRNPAKRFINLIDTLYDNRVRLIISAEAQPADLYHARSGTEAFEFSRTASRLNEMRSAEYLSTPVR